MSQTPLESLDLYGRQELQIILEANQAAGLAPETTPSVLGALAADAAKEFESTKIETAGWKPLTETLAQTEQLFNWIGLPVPGIDQLEAVGMNFTALESYYTMLEQSGQEPALLLVPSLEAEGDFSWSNLYAKLTRHSALPDNPLKQNIRGDGLFISEDAKKHWGSLHHIDQRNQDGSIAHSLSVLVNNYSGQLLDWQLCVLPATYNSAKTFVSHNSNNSSYPTISTYLTLQALRLQAELPLVDGASTTWLDGTLNRGTLAPSGSWNSEYGQVRIQVRDTLREPQDGVRMPEWG